MIRYKTWMRNREKQNLGKIKYLQDWILYKDVYSRRENLRENTSDVVYRFSERELELGNARNIEFQRVHRLGKRKTGQLRPIIICFLRFPERELVFRKVRDLGVESEVKVYADLPKQIRERRQELCPKKKKAREEGKVAFFDKRELDKLSICIFIFDNGWGLWTFYIVENQRWSLIPRAAYMDIKYLLVFLMRLKLFVCALFTCLLFLYLSSSFVQVLSAMYHLLIMHVSTILGKNLLHF